jgi:hypothetical protein
MDAFDEVVKRFGHGAVKYVPGSWQRVDDAVERYSAALMRHYSAYRQGERTDPEAPGLSRIGAVAWNVLVLVWFELRGYAPEKTAMRNDGGNFQAASTDRLEQSIILKEICGEQEKALKEKAFNRRQAD